MVKVTQLVSVTASLRACASQLLIQGNLEVSTRELKMHPLLQLVRNRLWGTTSDFLNQNLLFTKIFRPSKVTLQ